MGHATTNNDFGANEFENVMVIVQRYFDGLYHGNVATLSAIFHPDAFLKAPGLRLSLQQWLAAVADRPVPAQEAQPYDFKLLSIDVTGEQAMVKLECPLLNHFYIDFLGLLKESGCWLIVNKMYADLQRSPT